MKLLLILALLVTPAWAGESIHKCTAQGKPVLYSSEGCPEGYSKVKQFSGQPTQPAEEKWFYFRKRVDYPTEVPRFTPEGQRSYSPTINVPPVIDNGMSGDANEACRFNCYHPHIKR